MFLKSRQWAMLLIAAAACLGKYQSSHAQDAQIDTVEGYRIERFDAVTTNHGTAKANCEQTGSWLAGYPGWLVRIKTTKMQQYLEDITSGTSSEYYIGLEQKEGWHWNDGTELTEGQKNWATGEGSSTGEDCASIQANDGKWLDTPCSKNGKYICQSELIDLEIPIKEVTELEEESVTLAALVATQTDLVIVDLYKVSDMTNTMEHKTVTKNDGRKSIQHIIPKLSAVDAGEYIFIARDQTEPFSNRTGIVNVIVHVPASAQTQPLTIRAPVTTGLSFVTCSAFGVPTPSVVWKRSDNQEVITKEEKIDEVYQTIGESKSLLNVESANLNDQGKYTSVAKNSVTSANILQEDDVGIELTVFGAPVITKAFGRCGESTSMTANNKSKQKQTTKQ